MMAARERRVRKIAFDSFHPVSSHRLDPHKTLDSIGENRVLPVFSATAETHQNGNETSTATSTNQESPQSSCLKRGFPRGSFPCRHPACSRQEGQAECQHANAPPRRVPGRAVIVPKIAPRLPSQHWRQCRHQQERRGRPVTRLSCHDFVDNQVRLQLFVLAYNLGNFLRQAVMPRAVRHWTLTTLREKVIKIGAKIVRHSQQIIFQLAEVAVARELFRPILEGIGRLRLATVL